MKQPDKSQKQQQNLNQRQVPGQAPGHKQTQGQSSKDRNCQTDKSCHTPAEKERLNQNQAPNPQQNKDRRQK